MHHFHILLHTYTHNLHNSLLKYNAYNLTGLSTLDLVASVTLIEGAYLRVDQCYVPRHLNPSTTLYWACGHLIDYLYEKVSVKKIVCVHFIITNGSMLAILCRQTDRQLYLRHFIGYELLLVMYLLLSSLIIISISTSPTSTPFVSISHSF